jgi:hypothetical protein
VSSFKSAALMYYSGSCNQWAYVYQAVPVCRMKLELGVHANSLISPGVRGDVLVFAPADPDMVQRAQRAHEPQDAVEEPDA